MVFPLNMVIFHSYVSLPEGNHQYHLGDHQGPNLHLWTGRQLARRAAACFVFMSGCVFVLGDSPALKKMGMSENGVYPQWNSHFVGIVISKTIGCRGTLFSDKPKWCFFTWLKPQKCGFYGETSCAFLHGLTWLKPTKNWDPTQQWGLKQQIWIWNKSR